MIMYKYLSLIKKLKINTFYFYNLANRKSISFIYYNKPFIY